ncbi:flagellar basal-body rod protein FlgG [Haliovirga abyssi]|uniref:Flagellar basal-body rod protein FlgG n=1 Tax=Haliovirga abyssi TaxID=2996794 RepID=A0AAU9DK16_9FUSO|nr:flagellar basal-body rod protein FlgG [Haliovirga abyssi]BDU50217.1 flagellar basal body rod protein FlgG [Haliovirga abyssi]
MMNSLWSAASGMLAQELNMDVISNNLANTDSVGYKKSRVDFQDLLYQTKSVPGSLNAEGTSLPIGIQVGNGVRAIGTQKIFTDGEYTETGNDYDLAIQGQGFFQVLMPDGSMSYTRNGSFKITDTGQLVTADGFPLEPSITIPSDGTKMSVGSDGTVSVMRGNSNTSEEIGKIELAKFINPSGLMNIGKNLLTKTSASGDAEIGTAGDNGFGSLSQRTLETSNVKVVEEMVKMITAQRAYEVNTKSIQTADSMLQMANNLKR